MADVSHDQHHQISQAVPASRRSWLWPRPWCAVDLAQFGVPTVLLPGGEPMIYPRFFERNDRLRRVWPCCRAVAPIVLGLLLTVWPLAADTNAPSFKPKLPDNSLWPQGRY